MTIQSIRIKENSLQVRLDIKLIQGFLSRALHTAQSSDGMPQTVESDPNEAAPSTANPETSPEVRLSIDDGNLSHIAVGVSNATVDRIDKTFHTMSDESLSGDLFCHFDRTGRFVRATARDITIRRGLDNRLMLVSIDTTHREDLKWFGRRRHYRDFIESEKAAIYQIVYDETLNILHAGAQVVTHTSGADGAPPISRWIQLLQQWTPQTLAADKTRFQETYKPISILPPDQYKTLVIQVAEGCSYNECLFCDFYRDRRFHVKSPAELERHLAAIKDFFGPRLADRTGVFLGDGNALVVSADRLLVAIAQIRDALGPMADSFATFMDTFNLDKKSVEALHRVRAAGVDTVYVGLESGYDPIRSFLKKPGPASEALAAIRTLKQAGYAVGPIVMIGVGDVKDADAHFEHTVRLLQDANLTSEDKVFLSPFVQPSHSEYRDAADSDQMTPYPQDEIERELMRWKDTLNKTIRAKVTGYYVREHLY